MALYKNGASGAYGDPILPDEQGYYTIIFGQYRYTVSAEGYTPVSKTFNATDTALKNNNYVITVKLESPADKLLTQADNALFNVSGDGLAMIEYSGMHSDPDFGHYADIDSDDQDVNVQSAIEAYLAKKVKSDYPITVTVDKVENDQWDEDYTVIDKNGKIHYDAVTEDMLNFDETGAELTVSVTLTCLQSTKESEVTVLVPMHTYSRQERLDAAAKKGNEAAQLALDKFAYEVRKYIGAYAAALGGVDCIVFTAGVGENSSSMRASICDGLEYLGVKLDAEKNKLRGEEVIISTPDSKVTVWVIPTNEELMIAQDTAALTK